MRLRTKIVFIYLAVRFGRSLFKGGARTGNRTLRSAGESLEGFSPAAAAAAKKRSAASKKGGKRMKADIK